MPDEDGWVLRRLRRKTKLLAVVFAVVLAGVWADAWIRTTEVTAQARTLTGWTVLVDAGHGGYDGGACGTSGVWEKEINLQVARRIEAELSAMGAQVVMTRTADVDLCSEPRPASLTKKRQDMLARVALATENNVDMVLSIHMNYYRDRAQSGPQVFYRKGSDAGRLLAGCMQESLIEALQPKKERSALSGDYFILQLEAPSVLVECGFLSNPSEEKQLLDGEYQQRIAQAVVDGVMEYTSLTGIR